MKINHSFQINSLLKMNTVGTKNILFYHHKKRNAKDH